MPCCMAALLSASDGGMVETLHATSLHADDSIQCNRPRFPAGSIHFFNLLFINQNLTTMTDLYQNKYRIASIRLSSWDYRSNGVYFVTICTKNKKHYFGSINAQDQPDLTPLGKIAYQAWKEIPTHFPFVRLGPFVIMPNHVHGLIIIRHTMEPEGNPDQVSPKKGSLSSIVRSYKSACSKIILPELSRTGIPMAGTLLRKDHPGRPRI